MADEFDGERIVVHQQVSGNGEIPLRILAVRAAVLPRRGLDRGEERSIHHQLEMRELRQQAGRKSIVNVNSGVADHVRLRQREVDVVPAVDAVQFDLRRAGIVQGKRVAKLSLGNGGGLVDGDSIERSGKSLHLPVEVHRAAEENGSQRQDARGTGYGESTGFGGP